MKVVIKVGTQAILASDGTVDENMLLTLVEQIASLQQAGHSVVLVSSGAVGAGRAIAQTALHRPCKDATGERQLLSSLGQHELLHHYAKLFKPHNLQVAQLLLTKQDFHTRHHYLNIARLLNEALKHKTIIPIINENDSVAIDESMFTDNDELAGLIAAQIGAAKLIILTSVAGVYDRHPDEAEAELITLIGPTDKWPTPSAMKSCQGRGGMLSKLAIARKMSALGISVHIAQMSMPQVLNRIFQDEKVGTTILPRKKKSTIKKWIAFSDDQQSGVIHTNECLTEILINGNRAISILPVGIKTFSGQFKKGDLIEIVGAKGEKIGVGLARYDADKLSEYLGQHNKPVFIHYDHLYITIRNEKIDPL